MDACLLYICCKIKDWIRRDNASYQFDQEGASVMSGGLGLLLHDLFSFFPLFFDMANLFLLPLFFQSYFLACFLYFFGIALSFGDSWRASM
jgi:hypothetical protein